MDFPLEILVSDFASRIISAWQQLFKNSSFITLDCNRLHHYRAQLDCWLATAKSKVECRWQRKAQLGYCCIGCCYWNFPAASQRWNYGRSWRNWEEPRDPGRDAGDDRWDLTVPHWITSRLGSLSLVILTSQKAGSTRLVYKLELTCSARKIGIKKYTKYNIYIYLKLEIVIIQKITHLTALNWIKN